MRWANGFIAVDWGTTNRRAYRLDSKGERADEFEDSKGVLSVPGGKFPEAVQEIRERLGDLPLLLAGMVGSNKGWVEVPYVPCPAGIGQLVEKLEWVSDREAIVPGVSYIGQGRADVMRGEEVQLLGGVEAGTLHRDALVCHPGTHNKWALLRNGVIQTFGTVMTGELFSLLKDHSILAELLQGPVSMSDAFRQGVRHALEREMLPAALFEVRAAVLLGQMKREDAPSYISGLLIGTDVRIGLMWPLAASIGIMGRKDLTHLYAGAIEEAGREAIELDGEQSFLAGIRAIATRI
ncbi:MAG TPA: 2-dehydro-3-deoxygalactonokinase [Sphingomicrobium sp.]|jgi:2-dehydro-3-deoxygalactonokinase|nr:2-dehydro-3-deoxygalactonokinase [Sphingomicrobium sp.]